MRRLAWGTALAVLGLFGLAPARADDPPKQQEKQFEKEITVKAKLAYLLYLPPDYDKADKPFPLVLFLHGAGESGKDLKLVKKHGPPKLAETKDFPCVIVSPQCPGFGWDVDMVNGLLDDVIAHYKVDKDRVYLTGLSMGGFGTWALAAAHPEKFAAIAPICGGGNPADAKKLKDLPIRIFHGDKDTAVPIARSEEMFKALKDAGAANVEFKIYPGVGHDSWTATYDDQEFWDWLLKQKRGGGK
jgi:predicted peptidase